MYTVLVVFCTVGGLILLAALVGLWQLGHMDERYRDQLRWWWQDVGDRRAHRRAARRLRRDGRG